MRKKISINNRGFSYVEMIIVLAIIVIMVAMVTISMSTVSKQTASRTADKLETLVNRARSDAMTKGSENGYLVLAIQDGGVYAFVGNISKVSAGGAVSRSLVKENGEKLCKDDVSIVVTSTLTSTKYLQFDQSSGALRSTDSTSQADPATNVMVSKAGSSSSFTIYNYTGKTTRSYGHEKK